MSSPETSRLASDLASAVRQQATGVNVSPSPFTTPAQLEALSAAYHRDAGSFTPIGDTITGELFFELGDSEVDGPDVLA